MWFRRDWYKYRYMVILLFATTTRRLSMQDGVWLRRLKSVNGNKMEIDKENAEAKETGQKAPCDWEV